MLSRRSVTGIPHCGRGQRSEPLDCDSNDTGCKFQRSPHLKDIMFYRLVAEIFDEGDEFAYYVAQFFDDKGEDDEILAHGVANDEEDAKKQVWQAINEVR